MKKFLLLILLTFIFAIPTESDSVVSSLEIDPEEHLRKTISKEDWDQLRPFLERKFRDFLNSQAEESKKKSVEIPSTIWIKKHTTPDTIAKEADPSLGTLQQKVPSSHLSIVVPNNLPERTASIETKRPALQPQVESRVEDEVMKSALDKYKGRGQFKYDWKSWDKKESDHLSGVASSKAKKTRKRPTSQNWDFFLQLLEADRDKKDPYNPPIAPTVVRPAPSNRQIPKNTGKFGKVSPLDDEMMMSIPGDHQDLSHLNLDSDSTFSPLFWKNWDNHEPGSELSAVSPVSMKDNPPKTMSKEDDELLKQLLENFVLNEERDQYVNHLETDHTTHSSVPSTSQHVLEKESALQSVSNHRRIKNAGEMEKLMSKDNPSISSSKEIRKGFASSKEIESFSKLHEEWDQYLKHSETYDPTHSSVPSTSLHVLEEQSGLQSVSNHRRIKNAGMGKIMSKDNPSISISKKISKDLASSKEIESLNKLYEEWDKYLQHSNTNNRLALGDQTALQLAFKYRRFKSAGEMGKLMSKDNPSISISKKISKDLASSNAKEIFAKLPRFKR